MTPLINKSNNDDINKSASPKSSEHMTIREAIIHVLKSEERGMKLKEIYEKIIENNLYTFGAKDPKRIVYNTIARSCAGTHPTIHTIKDDFRFEEYPNGKRRYFLIDSIDVANPVTVGSNDNSKANSNIVLWDKTIQNRFLAWMEAGHYTSNTSRSYGNAIDRSFQNYSILANDATRDATSLSIALSSFMELLNQSSDFVTANNSAHNQYSAALKAFRKFIDTISDETSDGLSAAQRILSIIKSDYQNGFMFSPTAIKLLSARAKIDIDGPMEIAIKERLFKQHDDIWLFPESVVNNEDGIYIVQIAREWIQGYSFFLIDALYSFVSDRLTSKCENADDFESLFYHMVRQDSELKQLHTNKFWNMYRMVSVKGTNINAVTLHLTEDSIFGEISASSGMITEDELLKKFPLINAGFMAAMIKTNLPHVIRAEINGIVCYQSEDNLGLPENFSERISEAVEMLDGLNLPISEDNLHTVMSLNMGINLMSEYSLYAKKSFRNLIGRYYSGSIKRAWKQGMFSEVSD